MTFMETMLKHFLLVKFLMKKRKLLEITKESLNLGIKEVKVNAKIGNIGFKIQNYVEENGFSVVRELVGTWYWKKIT